MQVDSQNDHIKSEDIMIKKLYTKVQLMKSNGVKSWSIVYKINKVIVNIIYPMVALFNRKVGIDENSNVIVSLTTYPARIKIVWVTIASLLNQTYKPAKVLLYLSREQFINEFDDLPKNLINLQKRGLEIRFVDGDLKPHKKYYYSFKDFKENIVITTDDDIFYPENMIEDLVLASEKYPDAVICTRSHEIKFAEAEGECIFQPYNSWSNNTTRNPDMLSLPVGCNGVLYKPTLFDKEIFNIDSIQKNSLYTDDLWLKAMEIRNGIKTYNCSKEPLVYFDNIFTSGTGLWHVNADGDKNRNDMAWSDLIDAYPMLYDILIKQKNSI